LKRKTTALSAILDVRLREQRRDARHDRRFARYRACPDVFVRV